MQGRDHPVTARQSLEPGAAGFEPVAGMQEQQRPAVATLLDLEINARDRDRLRHAPSSLADTPARERRAFRPPTRNGIVGG